MTTKVSVNNLRCEYLENPLGIDIREPRLSWQITADRRGLRQSAYQIKVKDASGEIWDSGEIQSDQSIHVPYAGPPLISRQRYTWQVRVWDEAGDASDWSTEAWWEMGLLQKTDWQAQWIDPEEDIDPQAYKPCPYLRRQFNLPGKIKQARLYMTAHGCYIPYLNGERVGDRFFAPGYTSYLKRLQYQVYDVTEQLQQGENVIGVILGDGWWRGQISALSMRNTYGDRLALLAQMHITLEDGTEQVVISDGEWTTAPGPLTKSDMKDGETYDARLEMPGWNTTAFENVQWRPVKVVNFGYDNLIAEAAPPVRKMETFPPVKIIKTPAGQTVIDFGQNMAGIVQMKVEAPVGTTITLQHGEALDKAGNFSMDHLNLPFGDNKLLQQTQYTCKGSGEEVYEPYFTFQGFRYACVEGFPGEPQPENFTAIALYSDMAQTGTFACSNPKINQLQSNILWSQKSNFLDIPTDCPQRERSGWTGDAQIFVRTGAFNMDTAGFFTKWLRDLAADQHKNGLVPNLIPDPMAVPGAKKTLIERLQGSAGWGDAAVIIPWELYRVYGDKRLLAEQFTSMKAWVDYARKCASKSHWTKKLNPNFWRDAEARSRRKYIWDTKYHWGEWLEAGTSSRGIMTGIIKRVIFSEPRVATAYLAYSSGLLAEAARVLGKTSEAAEYKAFSRKVKEAFNAAFVSEDGRIQGDQQASYVRALMFDLVPDEKRPAIARRLVELIRKSGNHIGTGFLATVYICHALTEAGYLEVAYDLLNQDTVPSWLYPISKGATTVWERWDGIKPDGSVSESLNHYSPGAVGAWMYQVVAGLDLESAGYKHIRIQPRPGGGLTYARASFASMYGTIRSDWEIDGDTMRLKVTVPANTTATVVLPTAPMESVREGDMPLSEAVGIEHFEELDGDTSVTVAPGDYTFVYPWA